MKVEKRPSSLPRRILTAMIVSDEILGKIHRRIGTDHHPFGQRWSDLVARWCFEYFSKYSKAPKKSILHLFESYVESSPDPDSVELVEKFLGGLSRDYAALKEEINEGELIDSASHYFEKVRLERTANLVLSAVERDDLEEARLRQSTYQPIDFSAAAWKDPFSKESILDTFRRVEQGEPLVAFPGDLGKFLSPYFKRCDFVAYAGPEKRGKSFWLLETVWQAVKQKRKVLYYVFGDLPEHEVYQRLYCRILRRPLVDCKLTIPTRLRAQRDGKSVVGKFEEQDYRKHTPKDVWAARKKLLRVTASNQINLKVRVVGGNMIAASGIERDVKDFAKGGWVPDVVVIDYADLLLPEVQTKSQDVRHQMNLSWMILRRIALESFCLVVTATQAAATAYRDKWVLRKGDFSEDKRKNAHVTGMLGINQTDEEKEQGIYRLNWVALRGGHWSASQVVWTAGNLGIACPCIVSRLL